MKLSERNQNAWNKSLYKSQFEFVKGQVIASSQKFTLKRLCIGIILTTLVVVALNSDGHNCVCRYFKYNVI